jgi:hypothetical protein
MPFSMHGQDPGRGSAGYGNFMLGASNRRLPSRYFPERKSYHPILSARQTLRVRALYP